MHVVHPPDGGPKLVALDPGGGEGGLGAGVSLLPLVLEAHLPRVRGGREGAAATEAANEKNKNKNKPRRDGTNRNKADFVKKQVETKKQKRKRKTGKRKKKKKKVDETPREEQKSTMVARD